MMQKKYIASIDTTKTYIVLNNVSRRIVCFYFFNVTL